MDGNTRLCTATAAQALKETFGSDGQPASYADLDTTAAIMVVGHNMAATQTVLWSRILDRRRGPNPPSLVVIDPRTTPTAREADVHLTPRLGTNVAVLNGLLNLVIQSGQIDKEFIERSTVGFDALNSTVRSWTPAEVERVSNVPAARLCAAAGILAAAPTLVCTVLQGVYQSMQATAAAIQVNNLNLIRGLIGKPGCGVMQMNGQPTAQNTRECGADGDLPGFRNWSNPAHIDELARIWNVDPGTIPHWAPPTHAMQIFRYAEQGSIKMLWVSGSNPAVSLPELPRIRRILASAGLFTVVQDAFMTETAELADVILPVALWGEKTGCFTNVDRTVHISHKAVEPPGMARSDLDIFLDYARRMDFRDKDGAPLIKWTDPQGAFEAWKLCSRGRPCDYSGLSYEKLSSGSGMQWPCTESSPEGTERLYTEGVFNTAAAYCEDFGHDLRTGAARTAEQYRASDPRGKAFLHAADYEPPNEEPDDAYPLWLTTGRVIYHFHTRTKTGRSPQLNRAAPEVYVQISAEDSTKYGVFEGEVLTIESRRGHLVAPVRVGDIEPGHLFVPFHYGWWDQDASHRPRAANELTLTEWDPVSKQPHFKYAAVRIRKGDAADIQQKLAEAGRSALRKLNGIKDRIGEVAALAKSGTPLAAYLGLLLISEKQIVAAFATIAERHKLEPDICETGLKLRAWSQQHVEMLKRLSDVYRAGENSEAERIRAALFQESAEGGIGLLRDLHGLYVLVTEADLSWTVLLQAARAMRAKHLENDITAAAGQTKAQLAWLQTRIKQAAPQALTVT
jgi:anaerobic selenocysteine-containing dehydrogenase